MPQLDIRPVGTKPSRPHDDPDTIVARLYDTAFTRLTALGRRLTGDASVAEDLAQDIFLGLLRQLRDDPDYLQGPPWPWLRTAMVHHVANWRRQCAREADRLRRLCDEPEHEERWNGLTVDMERALARLPTRMRACTVLFYVEDMTVEDVARTLGCGVRTVETQLRRARPRLAAALGVELPVTPPPLESAAGATEQSTAGQRFPIPQRDPLRTEDATDDALPRTAAGG